MSRIAAFNAGPRRSWNTDTLVTEAAKGAESKGAEIVRFDLFRILQNHHVIMNREEVRQP